MISILPAISVVEVGKSAKASKCSSDEPLVLISVADKLPLIAPEVGVDEANLPVLIDPRPPKVAQAPALATSHKKTKKLAQTQPNNQLFITIIYLLLFKSDGYRKRHNPGIASEENTKKDGVIITHV
jgi:hypothetical protein